MFKSLMFLTALCSGVGMPVAFETAENQEVINFEYQNKKMVSYDDENYSITLSADELNNYVWSNFSHCVFIEQLEEYVTSITYSIYTITNITSTYDDYNNYQIAFISCGLDSSLSFGFNYGYDEVSNFRFNQFALANSEFEFIPFTDDLVIEFYSQDYNDIKQAIELDIQANSGNPMGNVLTEVVSLLVGGIVPFATGIGQGVSDLVTYTFIDNGALSVFGAMIAVFAGIALAVGLSRWVMNFLTSLGAKK